MKKEFPQQITACNGVLVFEDGSEVTLWGQNFQPCISWEYKFRMEHIGLPMTLETMKAMCDEGFRDLKRMKCDLIRCHLTPADFTDSDGNLVENMWLEMLDYMIAMARENEVYVSLAFINTMEWALIEDSFVTQGTREEWIFSPDLIYKTHTYVRQLINHVNPHTGIVLKNDPVIAAWEPINEPEYMTWEQVAAMPEQRKLFEGWANIHHIPVNDWYFTKYQYAVVKGYIDGLHDLLRQEGSQQPLIWNCNWPRMIVGRESVFDAIADSKADAISFCLYPGQEETGVPFLEHPADLSEVNYLPYLQRCYDDYFHLGWTRDPRFAGKAKVVYEFEQMYNAVSAYLYPAMAKLFRSLGVQMATMWTHCFSIHAPYIGGSHHLSLKTTPKKAVSCIIAGEAFRCLPRGFEYMTQGDAYDACDEFALSQPHNVSAFGGDGMLMYSGDLSKPAVSRLFKPCETAAFPLREIIGYGSSSFVKYEGLGLYFVNVDDDEVQVELMPHASFLREWWVLYNDGKPVTDLDDETAFPFELHLPGYRPVRLDAAPGIHCAALEKCSESGRFVEV